MGQSAEVNAWFKRYENPMKPEVERLRAIVLGADRRIEECIKWQAPTFTYRGNIASFFPKSRQHASLMFHVEREPQAKRQKPAAKSRAKKAAKTAVSRKKATAAPLSKKAKGSARRPTGRRAG